MQSARFFLAAGSEWTAADTRRASRRPSQSALTAAAQLNVPPLLQQYDFGGQLRTLEDSGSLPADVKPQLATPGASDWSRSERLPTQSRMYR